MRLLGEGGMGTVSEAILHGPAGFQKRVALKQLREGGEGLVHEAKLGGLLQHPHLVEVYALEEVEGTWVCAMELVSGGSLSAYVPLPPRAVVEVGLGVARGLAHAHEEVGLVHLDLKPANLLVHHGIVKVADLGISRARGFAGDSGVQGTPTYMAPEHQRAEAVDARSDIFSLGVVLIELATGNPDRSPHAVPWLHDVLVRCLAERPEDRFPSMLDVIEALSSIEVTGAGLAELARQRQPGTGRTTGASEDTFHFDGPSSEPAPLRTNIAPEADAFIGREAEVGLVIEMLAKPGITTLKGTGGLGKTRLARRAARQWSESREAEAWFADLSAATDVMGVLRTVAESLNVSLGQGDEAELAKQVGWALASRGELVLVLDNFEQVRVASGLVKDWRRQATDLRVLVTSREALRVTGEQVVPLNPLTEEEAVQLMVERARARGRHVEGDPALGELARRLDYLPLALELAAGRLGLMGVSTVLARIDERFKLLRTRDTNRSARQATMRGALDWSWDLLSDEERAGFTQCSVFVDGFTVEAAEAVLEVDSGWALDVVEALLDRSLLHQRADGRLGMYESTRAYAHDHLNDPAAEQRHAAYFASIGLEARAGNSIGGLAPELGNLLSACQHSLDGGWDAHALGAIAGAAEVVIRHGPVGTTLDLAERVTGLTGLTTDQSVLAHRLAAELSFVVGRNAVARLHQERAVALAEKSESTESLGLALVGLAATHRVHGELSQAQDVLERARTTLATSPALARGYAELEFGMLHYQRGELDEAYACFESIRALGARPEPHPTAAEALSSMGHIHADRGQFELARSLYRRALAVHRHRGDRRYEAGTLTNLGNMDIEQGRYDQAERYYTAALTMQQQSGNRRREGVSRSNLAGLYLQRGRVDLAETEFQHALRIHREVANRRSEGLAVGNMGSLHASQGRLDQAERCFERARDTAVDLGMTPIAGLWEGELGVLALVRGQHDLAKQQLTKGLAALEGRMAAYHDMFAVFLDEALAHDGGSSDVADAFARLQKLGASPSLARALASRARAASQRGQVDEAQAWLAQAEACVAEMGGGEPHAHAVAWARSALQAG